MQLTLRIQSDHLIVTILNQSSNEIRLWELENSWGWHSFSFELHSESNELLCSINRATREWTKNAPTYFDLSAGESRDLRFQLNDEWWEIEDVFELKNRTILVRAKLNIDRSPEAAQNGVFVGTVLSEWVVSNPPHDWLFL